MKVNRITNTMPKMAVKNSKNQNNKASLATQTNSQNPNFGMKFTILPDAQKALVESVNKNYPGQLEKFTKNLQKLINNLEPVYKGIEVIMGFNCPKYDYDHGQFTLSCKIDNDSELKDDMSKLLNNISNGFYKTSFDATNLPDLGVKEYCIDGRGIDSNLGKAISFNVFHGLENALVRHYQGAKTKSAKEIETQLNETTQLLKSMNVPDNPDTKAWFEYMKNNIW